MTQMFDLPAGEVDIVGRVHKILCEKPSGWCFASFLVFDEKVLEYLGNKKGKAFIKVSGNNLPKTTGITYKLHGKWEASKKDIVFSCKYSEMAETNNVSSVENILASENFPSISRAIARDIAKKFGKNTWNVIENEPEMLLDIRGITKEKMQSIVDSYRATKSVSSLQHFLDKFGVTGNVLFKIIDVYGDKAIEKIKANPYCMMHEVRGVGFEMCDRIAKGLYDQGEKNILGGEDRIKAAIKSCLLKECESTGAMYVEGNTLYKLSYERLNSGINTHGKVLVDLKRWKEVYEKMIDDAELVDRTFSMKDGSKKHLIFTKNYDDAERTIAYQYLGMRKRTTGIDEVTAKRTVKKFSDDQQFPLSEKQQEACVRSLTSGVSMIVGGPGTGKTTILRCLIACYSLLTGKEVTCMAPTGKATRRMSKSTRLPASTIHSRLGIISNDLASTKVNKINAGLVVIDEVSMVDTLLMAKVAESLGEHCHLVMVGDVDQLPSVGPGAVLLQLIKSGCIPTSRLTEVFRQKDGGIIVDNAIAINQGSQNLEYNDNFQFVEASNEEEAVQKIQEIFKAEVEEWGIDNVALLSPLRRNREGKHPCSSDGLNPLLQNMFNPSSDNEPFIRFGGIEYKANDRVMKWSNGEKSSNGDIGEVLEVCTSHGVPALEIKWDNGNTEVIRKQNLDEITLAYSMSIHKSQGSEYDSVIIPVLWSQKCPLFRRNLLYTGVTRAKKKVILVGDKRSINYMSAHADGVQRNTLLAARLRYNDAKYHE